MVPTTLNILFIWLQNTDNWSLTEKFSMIAGIVGIVILLSCIIQLKKPIDSKQNFENDSEEIFGMTIWDAKDVLGLDQAATFGQNRIALIDTEEDSIENKKIHRLIILCCILFVVTVICHLISIHFE